MLKITDKTLYVLEKLINRYLHLDPDSKTRLAEMENTLIEFTITGFFQCYCQIIGARLCLTRQASTPAHVSLKASAFDCLRLMKDPNDPNVRFHMQGNLEKARQFQSLLSHIEIDWEEQLAQRVGDPMAVFLFRILRGLISGAKETQGRLCLMLTEYLQNETQVLPTSEEIEAFLMETDEVRHAAARLEAKIARITSKKDKNSDKTHALQPNSNHKRNEICENS